MGSDQEGASETRKLGVCVTLQTGPKRGPRKLGNSETGIWGPLGSEPESGPRKLGNSESGICPGVSRNLHTRNLGIWNLRRSILESAHEETRNLEIGFPPRTYRGALESWKLGNSESGICREYPGICTLGNMKSGFWGPSADLRRGTGNSETRNLDLIGFPWRICTQLETWNLEFGFPCCKVAPPPPPRSRAPRAPPRARARALGYRSSLPGTSPPWSTVVQPLFVNGHLS